MKTSYIKALLLLVIAAVALWGAYLLVHGVSQSSITVGSDKQIMITPQRVTEIRQIGQFEFLSIVDEEVVDTVRRNLVMSADRLTCIFYGKLSVGINLELAPADWVVNHNDTVTVTLPQPTILDQRFIDEARTRVFFEQGRWSGAAKNQLMARAAARMRRDALSPANVKRVERDATARFTSLFMSLGAKKVQVRFVPVNNKPHNPS